jgi:hypothetical protein
LSKFVPTAPPPTTTFNVSSVKFHELSDEGLDMTDRLVKGFWARAGRDLSGWIIDHVNDQIPPSTV